MELVAHPTTPAGPVRCFRADASRDHDWLRFSWRLDGTISQIRIPPATVALRADGLWRHTCFEAFIAAPPSTAYCELNFSPSGQWAAYRFTAYRAGMTTIELSRAPEIIWRRTETELQLDVKLPAADMLAGVDDSPLKVAFAAVVEDQSGTIGYWAVRHPARAPDFHHVDGFVKSLPVGSGSAT
jgi:hypothetical protein